MKIKHPPFFSSSNIIEAGVMSGIKWFINTGTFWQHYDNQEYNPINLYAATKQAFEDILRYYRENSSVKITTLKLNDTFGPGDTRPKIFNLWSKIGKTGEILKMSPGSQKMDVLYIDNVIAAYDAVVKLLENDKQFEDSYMVTSDEIYSLRELAEIFSNETGRELNIEWGVFPYREKENMLPWNKGNRIPGWKPDISLREGLKILIGNHK